VPLKMPICDEDKFEESPYRDCNPISLKKNALPTFLDTIIRGRSDRPDILCIHNLALTLVSPWQVLSLARRCAMILADTKGVSLVSQSQLTAYLNVCPSLTSTCSMYDSTSIACAKAFTVVSDEAEDLDTISGAANRKRSYPGG
jgi:hypothetical protein